MIVQDVDMVLRQLRPKTSERRLRLFACGCCRQVWPLLAASARAAITLVERFVEGQAVASEVFAARSIAQTTAGTSAAWAAEAIITLTAWDTADAVHVVAQHAARALRDAANQTDWTIARRRQSALLLDILGKLDQPIVFNPRWLSWQDGTVRKLAEVIYREHRFADMPILGDALEEAGCDRTDILDHCRLHPEHARGCWLVDALLGNA